MNRKWNKITKTVMAWTCLLFITCGQVMQAEASFIAEDDKTEETNSPSEGIISDNSLSETDDGTLLEENGPEAGGEVQPGDAEEAEGPEHKEELSDEEAHPSENDTVIDEDVSGAIDTYEMTGDVENLETYEAVGDGLYQFVYRLYEKILQRGGDQEGMSYWYDILRTGKLSGAEVVMRFGDSPEMKAQRLDNRQFVERLYETCFGRASDAEGSDYWTDLLDKGVSRNFALKGFATSEEFRLICASFGINRGNVVLEEARDQNTGIAMFVYRCYAQCLGRTADAAGMNYWCGLLLSGAKKPSVITHDFLTSPEMNARNLDNTEFVKVLYRTYFGREYDDEGLRYWVNCLEGGRNRLDLISSFAQSREFAAIVSSFGLSPDDYQGNRVVVSENVREDGKTFISYDTLNKNGSYTFYQVKAADLNGGFCYAIVTPKGKLIMIDGGYRADAAYVKDFIREHGGVVDQWYITHPHFDHVGAFIEIMDSYKAEITVKNVYYSPFTAAFCYWANTSNQVDTSEVLVYDEFERVKTQNTDVVFRAMRRDDRASVDGINILCMNSFDENVRDVNSNSLVLRLETSGVVILVTGDITDVSVDRMRNYYGADNALWHADIVQAPHHGYVAGISNTRLYEMTNPKYVLVDCSTYEYTYNSVNVVTHENWIKDMGIKTVLRYKGTNEIRIN